MKVTRARDQSETSHEWLKFSFAVGSSIEHTNPTYRYIVNSFLFDLVKKILPGTHGAQPIHISKYGFAADHVMNKHVVDVGCDIGWGTDYLIARGGSMVVGGDVSKQALKHGALHYRRVPFLCFDAQHIPLISTSFDVVVSIEVIEHLQRPEDFLQECRRILRDGGLLVCSTPNKEVVSPGFEKPFYPFHVKEFTIAEFYGLLRTYFKEVHLFGQQYAVENENAMGKLANRIHSLSETNRTVQLVGKPIFDMYRIARLEGIDKMDLERIAQNPRYKPFSLHEDSTYLVAVARTADIIAIARK